MSFWSRKPGVTTAEVRAEVRRRIDELATGGGYIAAPSHGVPYDQELIDAMNDEIEIYRRSVYQQKADSTPNKPDARDVVWQNVNGVEAMGGPFQKTCDQCGKASIYVDDRLDYSDNSLEVDGDTWGMSARDVLRHERQGEAGVFIKNLFSHIMAGRHGPDPHDPQLEMPVFSFACRCQDCGHTWSETSDLIDQRELRSRLEDLVQDHLERATTAVVGVDSSKLSKFCRGDCWDRLLNEILTQHAPHEITKTNRVNEFIRRLPGGALGGGGFEAIGLLLYTITVGVVTNLLWELAKSKSRKLRDVLSDERISDIARQKSQEFQEEAFDDPRGSLEVRVSPSPELVATLAAMPRTRREAIVDDIALQHAMNVRDDLLISCGNASPHNNAMDSDEE